MKTQLIMLPQPILTVPKEKASPNDFIWTTNVPIERVKEIDKNYSTQKGYEWLFTVHGSRNQYKSCEVKAKIIAGIPELPSVTYSDEVSKTLQERCGWVDVYELAEVSALNSYTSCRKNNHEFDCPCSAHEEGYVKGFKAAQSLNEKKFSEWEFRTRLKLAIHRGHDLPRGIALGNSDQYVDNVIRSLSQPKVFDVEVEMELRDADEVYFELQAKHGDYWNHHFHYYDSGRKTIKKEFEHLYLVPKITNNSIKVIKVL